LIFISLISPVTYEFQLSKSRKKPVVATTAGGVPEIVKDRICGILIPPKDPDAIANAVIELAKDKTKLIKLGDAGKKLVEKKFSLSTHIQMVERLYNIFIS